MLHVLAEFQRFGNCITSRDGTENTSFERMFHLVHEFCVVVKALHVQLG